MLADYESVPTLAVKDLERARGFYEGVLGFVPRADVPDGMFYTAGSSAILVYPSAYAGTNKATAMSIQIPQGSFDSEVSALRNSGISFQTFEMDGVSWDDGVATFGDDDQSRAVWFEDLDGNILNLESTTGA